MKYENLPDTAALLTVAEMYRADAAAIAGGVAGMTLMEAAGSAVAEAVLRRTSGEDLIAVLCGPGNNGGDGFIAARLLWEAGRRVRLGLLGERGRLAGDAATAADRWPGEVEVLSPALLDGADMAVDAIFGAGLTRDVDGVAGEVLRALMARMIPVVAVDVPSGVDGDSGLVRGVAAPAIETVCFFRRKPGHLLLPGRDLCGVLTVADIGIPPAVLADIKPKCFANGPAVWGRNFPWPQSGGHKYSRGKVVVQGGEGATGAARLAAEAALRIGAGLVVIASPAKAAAVYRAGIASLMVAEIGDIEGFASLVGDTRVTGMLVGPGNGLSQATRGQALSALATGRPCVLDADALTVFADDPGELFAALQGACVLTPHEGEFARLFGGDGVASYEGKVARVRSAAAASGGVVLLKGSDSVIANSRGLALINENAPASLATAGSGDVLAGLITGLMAQGMAPLDAAGAGVWLHGAAAASFGPGLIADDLVGQLPIVLARLAEALGAA